MFCSNCGKALPDDARFCDGCGAKMDAGAVSAPEAPAVTTPVYQAAVAPKKNKGLVIGIVSAAVVLVGVVVAIIASSFMGAGATSPEKVAEKFAVAYCTMDAEAVVDCIPDFMVENLCSRYYAYPANRKNLAAVMQRQILSLDDYETISVISARRDYTYDTDDLNDYISDAGMNVMERAKIKDYCAVNVTAVVSGEMENLYVICIKLKNRWYAIDID